MFWKWAQFTKCPPEWLQIAWILAFQMKFFGGSIFQYIIELTNFQYDLLSLFDNLVDNYGMKY
jgi:hypothetical protein